MCPYCRIALEKASGSRHCPICEYCDGDEERSEGDIDARGPAGFDQAATRRLMAMDDHFWMRGRRHLVEKLLLRHLAPRNHVVELGCGTGSFLPLLEGFFPQVTAVDTHLSLLGKAARRSRHAELVRADVSRTPLPGQCCDAIVALDVIEHVDPDALLREARRLCAPGGLLLVSAPASPALWSPMDSRAGHRRRYDRATLLIELERNGWSPLGTTHYQCLLFPLVWLSARLGQRTNPRMERDPPLWLDRLLGAINFFEIEVFHRVSLPFGSSLFACAKKD